METLKKKLNALLEAKVKLDESLMNKLPKSILQDAIQGKLIPQDPTDEPASVLLERIAAEKQQLVKDGKLKAKDAVTSKIFKGEDNKYYEKTDNATRIIDDEIPFIIPSTWAWCRLDNVCMYIHRGKSPKYSEIKKVPVVAQKCNQWSGFSIEKAQFIDPATIKTYSSENFLQDNDLLWNSTGLGTLGRMAIYNTEKNPYGIAVADSHVTVIRLMSDYVNPKYLYYYFSSPTVQNVIEDKSDGSTKQKELSTKTICAYIVPLPPKAEQDRIVIKIEEALASIMSR